MVQRRVGSSVRVDMPRDGLSGAAGTPGDQGAPAASSSSAGGRLSAASSGAGGAADLLADRWDILLLVVLYAVQGLPMGFVFGSIPFMLKERIGYDSLAVFSFAGWPYSIKLLVAPVVDAVYSPYVGRRKSWIVPAQALSGTLMLVLAARVEGWVKDGNVAVLTPVFFAIMSVTACQDIAVDSWALTLLKPVNLPYASACQAVGLGAGTFASFTIFLALQDDSFCDAYIRPWVGGSGPLVALRGMLRGIGVFYLVITVMVFIFKTEAGVIQPKTRAHGTPARAEASPHAADVESLLPLGASDSTGAGSGARPTRAIAETYKELYRVMQLPAIRQLVVVLLFAKVAFSAHDNVSALKLLDRGFPKQTMAMMAVFHAPVSLLTSVLAGRLSVKYGPVRPYIWGFCIRVVLSLSGPALVAYFRALDGVVTPGFYTLVLVSTMMYSIGADVMFVCLSALFLSVGDQDIGGSYLTLLTTCSNLGGMWHKPVTLFLVDFLSVREECALPPDALPSEACPLRIDGYYVLCVLFIPVAIPVGVYMNRTLRYLVGLPKSAWRTGAR